MAPHYLARKIEFNSDRECTRWHCDEVDKKHSALEDGDLVGPLVQDVLQPLRNDTERVIGVCAMDGR